MASKRAPELLTVAAVRPRKGKPTEYVFNESARVFELGDGKDAASHRLLLAAHASGHPLELAFDKQRKLIQRVSTATESRLAAHASERALLEAPEGIVPIEVAKLEPVKFDGVDASRKWGALRRCTRIVPNYAKAKEIFDFCANLSCSLPGPYAVSPCIPFQYVIDGCYARAHQMRRIITGRYRYCCDKVFSFATVPGTRLGVRASKWGGCCVSWWYHVAPIITVRTRVWLAPLHSPKHPGRRPPARAKRAYVNLAYVIDPGMFDQPVLLSTWLAAQENSSCFTNAKVTSYSIQPGSAYTPAGTGSFSTDPSYTQTEATLLAYANLTTC